jgi:hypothetical protein
MISCILLSTTIIVCSLLSLLPKTLARTRRRREKLRRHRAEFFKAAMRLTNHEHTPDSVLRTLTFMSNNIRSSTLAHAFLFDAMNGKLRRAAKHPSIEVQELCHDMEYMGLELRACFNKAITSFICALCYSQPLTGRLLRRGIFYGVDIAPLPVTRIVGSRAIPPSSNGYLPSGGNALARAA